MSTHADSDDTFVPDPASVPRLEPGRVPVSAEFQTSHEDHGFPWCDTCKAPAVWSQGPLHANDAFPDGVPAHADSSGHEVTLLEWSERGQ